MTRNYGPLFEESSLYKPIITNHPLLSKKDERDIARIIRGKKYTPDEKVSARNKLVEHNLRIVASIAGKYSYSQEEFNILYSEGLVTLIDAAEHFNPRKDTSFSTYATHALQNRYRRLYVENKERITQQNYKEITSFVDDRLVNYSNEIPESPYNISHPEFFENTFGQEGILPLDEKEIELFHYLSEGKTYREIAKIMKVSKSSIGNWKKNLVRKARQRVDDLFGLQWIIFNHFIESTEQKRNYQAL